ncbi:2-keto-4-pentenoate hydratase/2-oxohepta-3-ene-1,7-dioic acid hydratase in catechol pathway [Bacillus thermophilus]|uniref:2-keto-4-pentenoate hydratase/2-oxohepta-3-ene-1,7-dioic acid hydratase in catechol pathway n=1 Tax=Siminovitchia thermophila TaxID=1245522 RepID=A0ABS2RCM3_9BACI|nr:fumarylacetoacetate hydrolase family protein [Siminovitchia thermophila]MBM7717416.1 2-keto-4-pentenoate hydratase/2-oxohepta-3-ene-1,7-dioic acid hydratase in catechol pathway [Siminovitchia thermophila]
MELLTIRLVQWGVENGKNEYQLPLEDVKWLPPIPKPWKNIMCVGKNYRDHAIEMGSEADIPKHMIVFTKAPTTVIGHKDSIEAHEELTNELDYEGELAVVIGKQGRNIAEADALDYVFGYTIVNDITARDLQVRHKQYFLGKSLDSSCPMGPWIVHHSEIKNPNGLNIQTRVNGEIRQNSNTEHFIFPIEEIIATLSQGMTLEPGDIIATGTPSGVGKGFKPPRLLSKGDEVEIYVEGIGKLNNTVN